MSILDGSTSYDPTAMPNQIGNPTSEPTSSKDVKEAKPSAKKIARDLLASFAPAAPVVESAAEKERKRRVEAFTVKVRQVANTLDELGALDGDPAAAAAGLKALNTALTQGTKALQAISDAKLAPEPKAPRTPKSAKVDEIAGTDEVTVHPSEAAATAAVETSTQASSVVDSNTGF